MWGKPGSSSPLPQSSKIQGLSAIPSLSASPPISRKRVSTSTFGSRAQFVYPRDSKGRKFHPTRVRTRPYHTIHEQHTYEPTFFAAIPRWTRAERILTVTIDWSIEQARGLNSTLTTTNPLTAQYHDRRYDDAQPVTNAWSTPTTSSKDEKANFVVRA